MSRNHESFFTYAVTRPFPFKWYTPVLVIGGILFTTAFTFLNLASSGYDLIVRTSFNPNVTVSQDQWLRRWPSYLTSKISPVCQPVDLPVNGQFFTNQTALTYVLRSVWQKQDNDEITILPSLTYHNNILESCSVTSVGVEFQALDQAANQFAYSLYNAVVRTYATCQISNTLGRVFFNLSQTYDYVPTSVSFAWVNNGFLGTEFLARDKQARASLWWGESLMSNYWAYSTRLMQEIYENKTEDGGIAIRKGFLYFEPTGSTNDMTNLDFFKPDYRFMEDFALGGYNVISSEGHLSISSLDQRETYPNIWVPVDTLAKSAYSTILADLGQADQPNLLSNTTTLEYFTANLTNMRQHMANAEPGPERDPFHAQSASAGPLGVVPSVISTRYLCQVPQLKSTGNLIVAILIANLVLLRTAWQLFKMGAETYLVRTTPRAMMCEGCKVNHLDKETGMAAEERQSSLSDDVSISSRQVGGQQYTRIPLDMMDSSPSGTTTRMVHA